MANDEKAMIARLRASKRKFEGRMFQQGFEDGQRWAKEDAEAEELTLLSDCYDEARRRGTWEDTWAPVGSAYGSGECFVFTVCPDFDGDRGHAHEFWEACAGENHERFTSNPDYVRGFAEGALDVWNSVEDEV